jgi:hypothetical protein
LLCSFGFSVTVLAFEMSRLAAAGVLGLIPGRVPIVFGTGRGDS